MLNSLLKLIAKIYPEAKKGLKRFHGGIFPKTYKELSNRTFIANSIIPKELVLPLKQHAGIEVEAIVKVGDKVKKNQLLADTRTKDLHAPIHAPTSGTIIAIEQRQLPHSSGFTGLCIVIQTDGINSEIINSLGVDGTVPNTPLELKNIIYKAGIVGMGGAGFPTFAKIPDEKGLIKTLIINGAECEPFITCDDVLMQNYAPFIITGANIVAIALGCKEIICAIEDNKPQAIKQMLQESAKYSAIKVQSIASVYPMGGEKQLIKEIVNLEIPAGTHAINSGVLVINVATIRAIEQAVIAGKPLTSRIVTVAGLSLTNSYNIEAMLGTSFNELIDIAKPKTPINYQLIQGGPMMGFKVPNNKVPVTKVTNCILANPPEETTGTMPCIRCGECMDVCPVNLLPQQLYWHAKSQELEKTEKLNLFDCIECGSCSFVCPSNIPLVQYYRFAKSEIKKIRIEQKNIERAKMRHENKQAREKRLQEEKTARLKAKKEAIKLKAQQDKGKDNIKPNVRQAGMSAREKAIAMAKKRMAGANTTNNPRQAALEAARKRAALKKATQNNEQQTTQQKSTQQSDNK